MKAALITEEQIKAIEDALESLHTAMTDGFVLNSNDIHEALAILKSLKVQEPVAWFDYDSSAQIWVQVYPNTHGKPLYTGEQP